GGEVLGSPPSEGGAGGGASEAKAGGGSPAPPWYEDFLELCRFGSVLGQWTTVSSYLNDVLAGEHVSSLAAGEFQSDCLLERTAAHNEAPVSGFARQARLRRRLDTAWSLAGILRGLAGRNDPLRLNDRLARVEEQVELSAGEPNPDLPLLEKEVAEALA